MNKETETLNQRTINYWNDLWQSFCVLSIILLFPMCIFINIFMISFNGWTRWIYICGYGLWTIYDRFSAKRHDKIWWCARIGQYPHCFVIDSIFKSIWKYFEAEVKFVDRAAVEEVIGPTIFGCHPHGIFGISTLLNFGFGSFVEGGMNANVKLDTSQELKRLKRPIHVLTLSMSFWIPIWRDILIRFGLGPVDKKTCLDILLEAKESIAVVVGGAREAMLSSPGHCELIIKRRLGIFKIAIKTGCPIVPVLSFGEVDLYDQISLPWPLNRLQTASIHLLGFSMPILKGRFGTILPYRKKLLTIIGEPIDPSTFEGQTENDQVSALQAEYIKQLEKIFENYCTEYYDDSSLTNSNFPTFEIK